MAAKARVSTSTVSRFLNGKKRLSPGTERRIQNAVNALGYAPNRVARSLRMSRTSMIGMLIPDSSNPFFSGVVKGAEDAARSAGFALILFSTNEDADQELAHLGSLRALRCDGALLIAAPVGPNETAHRKRLEDLPLPIVCVERTVGLPFDTVIADNRSGAYEATRHLIDLGHRRIGLVSADREISSHVHRREGYAQAMAEARLRAPVSWNLRSPLTVNDGFRAASRLLALDDPPTAIFAASNSLCLGAVAALRSARKRCPDDVSVVGYDSYDWQDMFEPRLSTVKQPAYLLGQRSAELLIDRITGKKSGPPEEVILRPELVVRGSTAAARRA